MRFYCTLFDSHYLARGLAMIRSLHRVTSATVYVLCMDEASYAFFQAMPEPGTIAISLAEFEDDDLKEAKRDRSRAEYCWTCTPALIAYCIQRFGADECTYVDADLFFLQDPAVMHERMGDAGVLITPHRYSAYCDRSSQAGIFCVQYMTFCVGRGGGEALAWWRDRCIEWCYARAEDDRFGDQKYLDDWPRRFSGVHVAGDPDVGVAPWNIADYRLNDSSNIAEPILEYRGRDVRPVFYHFHGVRLWRNGLVDAGTNYRIGRDVLRAFCIPYLRTLLATNDSLSADLQNAIYEPGSKPSRLALKKMLWRMRGTCNLINASDIHARRAEPEGR